MAFIYRFFASRSSIWNALQENVSAASATAIDYFNHRLEAYYYNVYFNATSFH